MNLAAAWLVQMLTSHDPRFNPPRAETYRVEFVQAELPRPPTPDTPEKTPPPPPPLPPPPLPKTTFATPPPPALSRSPLPELPRLKPALAAIGHPEFALPAAPAAPTTSEIPLSTGLTPAVRIPPEYPLRARRANLEGIVLAELSISQEGEVEDVQILSEEPPGIFAASVIRAVRRWRYEADPAGNRRRIRQEFIFQLED